MALTLSCAASKLDVDFASEKVFSIQAILGFFGISRIVECELKLRTFTLLIFVK